MNVLLIGSGGREHAIALALARSPSLARLSIAPGNPGMAEVGEIVALDAADHAGVARFCAENDIGLVVVGPEQPLVDGLADALCAAGVAVFGPSKAAARLEGSKGFVKDLCRAHAIPTADYARFSDQDAALAHVRAKGAPIVVKADGLAAGKGVVVAETLEDAERAVEAMFSGAFGASGAEVVIEEKLEGEEISFFALCDGARALPFASAQDHKRVGEGDTGPNTGGMGAYSPAPAATAEVEAQIMSRIVEPTLEAMRAMGAPFCGALFAGLMLTTDGPKLIEFNVRFGDPETQAMLPRLEDDLLELMLAAAKGALPAQRPRFSPRVALTVVLAARGYPGTPLTGTEIRGVERARALEGVVVTHAGTRRDGARLLAAGGRVLNVTALADTVSEAQRHAYAGVDAIDWPEGFCRRDIGWRAAARERAGAGRIAPNLTGVPETMLWTLHNRAGEAMRADAVLKDAKTLEIYHALDYDYEASFGAAEPSHANRAAVFDDELRAFLAAHPDGVIVNLGEGLETHRYRVGGAKALWITVDLPEAIAIRERFIAPDAQHRHVATSALDRRWFDAVPPGRPVYITAQGLLMYLPPEEVASLVADMAKRFPGARFCFDHVPRWLSKQTLDGYRPGPNFTVPPMPWGIDRSEIAPALRDWAGIEQVETFDYRLYRGLRGFFVGWLSQLPWVRERLPAITRATFP
jgi:phosphoribosylamine--glycine ligase